jgi:hypothetical protein
LVWAKEVYEHLGFVYASGVAGGPTADEIRRFVLEPARTRMVSGDDRGGKGSR